MAVELNVFVAGSKQLETERNLFKLEAQNVQMQYKQHKKINVQINVCTFESFSPIFNNKEELQEAYNQYIREQAEVVFFVFDGAVGGITIKEYDVAENAYIKSNTKIPQLCVFSKLGQKSNDEIDVLKKRVNNLGQYWTDYKNIDDLRYQINKALTSAIDKKIIPSKIKLLHLFLFLLPIIALIVFGILFYEQSFSRKSFSYDVKVVNELSTCGRLIICPDSAQIVKYSITSVEEDINWNDIDRCIEYYDTIYPKDDCFINIYGYFENDMQNGVVKKFQFSLCDYVESAIKEKNRRVIETFIGLNPIELELPGGVKEILYTNPLKDLYSYLTEYDYHIVDIKTTEMDIDVEHAQYSKIAYIKLSKDEN